MALGRLDVGSMLPRKDDPRGSNDNFHSESTPRLGPRSRKPL